MRILRLIIGWAFVASAAGWFLLLVGQMFFGAEGIEGLMAMSVVFGFASLVAGVAFHPGDRPGDG